MCIHNEIVFKGLGTYFLIHLIQFLSVKVGRAQFGKGHIFFL